MTTVGRYLVRRLHELGVKHLFGVPGDYVLDLMDLVIDSPIEFIGTCNELNAGYAADAYGRLNGISAAMVTYGVGGFSLLNAAAGAYAERVPMVMISGAPHSARRRAHAPMHHLATDYRLQLDIYSRVTAAAVMLTQAEQAPGQIDCTLQTCLMHKRPVYIEVPVDMVDAPCAAPSAPLGPPPAAPSHPDALAESLVETTAMLAAAQHPAILCGVEVHRFGLRDDVVRLLDACGYPVATTVNGKTAIPEEHPGFVGIYEGALSRPEVLDTIESADCLLSLGAWFTDIATGGFTAKLNDAKMISANSDRVKIKHHHYDNVYLADFVRGLIDTVQPTPFQKRHVSPAPHITEKPYQPDPAEKITVKRFFERLNTFLNDDMILIAATGDAMFGAAELHTNKPESFLAQANYLSIGYSLPATLGVSLAAPNKRAVLVIGDGAFQMTAQELSTILRDDAAPILFLLNNDGYLIERAIHDGPYNEIRRWKYHELPPVFGGPTGLAVYTEGDLEEALKKARECEDELVFVEIVLDRNDATEALRRIGQAVRKQSEE
ncbi:MAG: alpha-keto acid decarboxylase family protein [Phycisphaerae bacterium]|nr:alpha-keto acid decarboxylase family protein [Phycisphaerae bacterium]